ncbi:peptidoglycan editing factor PgeF [Aliivibrio kagoshimensis]|uniref:peptidoglycan editing factor PgeF n=1 Tax=Aliivibrio kagoshimensis TaxID=2910230 RepID=UPI003D0BAB8F
MNFIIPNWPAANNVKALSTLRKDGFSQSPFDSFNVGAHVGDDIHSVEKNRLLLLKAGELPSAPVWLNQTHSTNLISLPLASTTSLGNNLDGSLTSTKHQVCCVMTADCLPVLFCDKAGTKVAAVHAGWRGLCDGILEQAVKALDCTDLMAWIGPAIGRASFEVGDEVKQQFIDVDTQAEDAFSASSSGKWLADMNLLATQRLNRVGVLDIYYSNLCTYQNNQDFFSYRKEGQTGRQATLIWLE